MKIKCDTREQENSHILKVFDELGVEYIIDKPCSIGDYCNLDNPGIFVERKKDWTEFAGNCGKSHSRFKRELERLDECGGKMVILIETMQPLEKWQNKRSKMTAVVMQKIIDSWKLKHNIEVIQCCKWKSAYTILEVLK